MRAYETYTTTTREQLLQRKCTRDTSERVQEVQNNNTISQQLSRVYTLLILSNLTIVNKQNTAQSTQPSTTAPNRIITVNFTN